MGLNRPQIGSRVELVAPYVTDWHIGASQDVPLLFFFLRTLWRASRALEQWCRRIVARLHYCTGCTLPLLGLVAQ